MRGPSRWRAPSGDPVAARRLPRWRRRVGPRSPRPNPRRHPSVRVGPPRGASASPGCGPPRLRPSGSPSARTGCRRFRSSPRSLRSVAYGSVCPRIACDGSPPTSGFAQRAGTRHRRHRSAGGVGEPATRRAQVLFEGIVGTSRLRPFDRRRRRTARPPAVDIRARNPWLRFRFVRLGWYVRFTRASWSGGARTTPLSPLAPPGQAFEPPREQRSEGALEAPARRIRDRVVHKQQRPIRADLRTKSLPLSQSPIR